MAYRAIPPVQSGGGTIESIASADGSITVTDGTGPDVDLALTPGECASPDWFGQMRNTFVTKTGLSPLTWSVLYESDFADFNKTVAIAGGQSSGTGAGAAYENGVGGILKLTSPNSGAGYGEWQQGGAGFNPIGNVRTKRFMCAYRLSIGTAPAAASRVVAGFFCAANIIGIGYSGAQANWQYCRGANAANITATDEAIDSSGSVYMTLYVANFDLTSIVVNPDVAGGHADVVGEVVGNLPNNIAYGYLWNEGAGSADVIRLDKVLICAEL
jgi:hypothetical protein